MSLKGQHTTSDYLEWDRFQLLTHQLERDGEKKFCLLISCGCYLGLRISDLLKLTWKEVLNQDHLIVTEKKTGKRRKLSIHPELQDSIQRLYEGQPVDEYLFLNKHRTQPVRVQYVNRRLKELMNKYEIKGNYTSHFMRKTLGRRVWNKNNHSEKSLVMLGEVFNHTSIATTKIYLGIREQEIQNIYLNL